MKKAKKKLDIVNKSIQNNTFTQRTIAKRKNNNLKFQNKKINF